MRIVSLVPSLSQTICDLKLQPQIVGCTSFCVLPPNLMRTTKIVGGTKDPDLLAIAELKPTHIIVNQEENQKIHVEQCQAIAPTLLTYPKVPQDVPKMLSDLGAFLGCGEGEKLACDTTSLLNTLHELRPQSNSIEAVRYLYFIWREPYMVAGTDTYISGLLDLLGWENAAPEPHENGRYPTMTIEDLKNSKANLILLSSEPYPFRLRDRDRLVSEWPACPFVLRANGQLFSWYGSLTIKALEHLKGLHEHQLILWHDIKNTPHAVKHDWLTGAF